MKLATVEDAGGMENGEIMFDVLLTAILVIALFFSIFILIIRRRRAGITGVKTALSPICLYVMAIVNMLAYWLGFMGIVSWSITILLLILAAYFTKYIPTGRKD